MFEVIEEEEVKQWACEIGHRIEHEEVNDEFHVEEKELRCNMRTGSLWQRHPLHRKMN